VSNAYTSLYGKVITAYSSCFRFFSSSYYSLEEVAFFAVGVMMFYTDATIDYGVGAIGCGA
jgi:hypothetical protein